MSSGEVNKQRRYFLIGATSVVGGLGIVGAAVPFVASWSASAKAKALGAPITVDISKLEPGAMLGPIPAWRGQPIFIVNRTKAMLESIRALDASRLDPNSKEDQQPPYAQNEFRARKPEFGVYVGICTHLGCSPKYFPEVKPEPFDANWGGGFFCPCHGSKFDLAGRVAKEVPAPLNLVVPPYVFLSDTVLKIGVNSVEEKA
jgi:ubiquinol-cytochrome c reductase iron-sulfur subunit